ncbi:MAG: hypothetical protein KBC48_01595 [Candidatus Pacebacteria bacterium]|nr:hypothetical protein [Candidatus Paceibacterota bacterium]
MAINLQLPGKKFWWLLVAVIIVTIGLLWYHGRGVEQDLINERHAQFKDGQAAQAYYQEIITRTTTVRESAVNSLETDNLETLVTSETDLNSYNSKSFKLGTAEDATTLKAYGEKIGAILKPYGEPRENELKVLLEALNSQQANDLLALREIRQMHEQAVTQLLALVVPKSAATLHLKLINNLSAQAHLLTNMEQVFTQPLLALESAQALYQHSADFYLLAGEINIYFQGRNIIFNNQEGAKIYQTI